MSDLIRREDVENTIQRLCDLCGEEERTNGVMCGACNLDNFIRVLNDIPSAEPELEEHEWCHDCKEYDQEKHCCHRWNKVIRNTVEEIKTKYWKWIPVTEALPEEKGEYLVSYHPCHWNTISEKVLVGMDTFRGKTTWAKKKYQKVIAWMPLPEPYEVTDERLYNVSALPKL